MDIRTRISITIAFVLLTQCATRVCAVEYQYDDINRLTSARFENGIVISYSYDASGNRTTHVMSEDTDADGIGWAGGPNPCTGGNAANCFDNCPAVANADQADMDGDGIGNVCDGDIDGDGLLNIHETGTGLYVSPTDTGSNPSIPDTDGDGVSDGAEVAAGTDPNTPSSTGDSIPTLGQLGSALMALMLLLAGRWALAKRRKG